MQRRDGIAGHVALVAAQVGVLREVIGSSHSGVMVLNREELEIRLATARRVGGDGVWLAGPNEVVAFILASERRGERA